MTFEPFPKWDWLKKSIIVQQKILGTSCRDEKHQNNVNETNNWTCSDCSQWNRSRRIFQFSWILFWLVEDMSHGGTLFQITQKIHHPLWSSLTYLYRIDNRSPSKNPDNRRILIKTPLVAKTTPSENPTTSGVLTSKFFEGLRLQADQRVPQWKSDIFGVVSNKIPPWSKMVRSKRVILMTQKKHGCDGCKTG